jgi:hypothetical protein
MSRFAGSATIEAPLNTDVAIIHSASGSWRQQSGSRFVPLRRLADGPDKGRTRLLSRMARSVPLLTALHHLVVLACYYVTTWSR